MGVGNDFTDYMGYRYCELESRIDDCLTAIAAGETLHRFNGGGTVFLSEGTTAED